MQILEDTKFDTSGNMTDLKRSVLFVKLLSLFSLRAPLVCGQLLLQQHELLPRLPQLLVQLGPGLVEAGTGVAARDDPGRCGPQVGVGIHHAQDQVVKVLGEAVQVLELASLYVLVVGVVEAVPREDLEAGGLVDGQTEAEDVRLGQLARVHVHLEELGRHVAAVSLLRSHRGSAVDGRHVPKVSDLVAYLILIMIIILPNSNNDNSDVNNDDKYPTFSESPGLESLLLRPPAPSSGE